MAIPRFSLFFCLWHPTNMIHLCQPTAFMTAVQVVACTSAVAILSSQAAYVPLQFARLIPASPNSHGSYTASDWRRVRVVLGEKGKKKKQNQANKKEHHYHPTSRMPHPMRKHRPKNTQIWKCESSVNDSGALFPHICSWPVWAALGSMRSFLRLVWAGQ